MTDDPRRILLIRPSALGDVCRTVPVLATLRRRYPDAQIDWLVRDLYLDAVRAHPALTNAVAFERDATSQWMSKRGSRALVRQYHTLRDPRYDLAIDCQGLARSGLFAFATGARRRIGFAKAGEFAWLAYTERIRTNESDHVVARALSLARAADCEPVPDITLTIPAETPAMDARLESTRYAVIAPGSAWPGKCWPAERFADLSRRLLADSLVDRVVLVGTRNERTQAAPTIALANTDDRVHDFVGQSGIAHLMRLISRSSLVVANDSAAMHMAVGFRRPLVALLGPTDAALAGPYQRANAVVQVVTPDDRLSHRACRDAAYGEALMRRIPVELALEKAGEQLQNSSDTNGQPHANRAAATSSHSAGGDYSGAHSTAGATRAAESAARSARV